MRTVKVWSKRKMVLWLTGRDLLVPPSPPMMAGIAIMAAQPQAMWSMTLVGGSQLEFRFPAGPNVLHRLTQRVALGITWRMLPGVL